MRTAPGTPVARPDSIALSIESDEPSGAKNMDSVACTGATSRPS